MLSNSRTLIFAFVILTACRFLIEYSLRSTRRRWVRWFFAVMIIVIGSIVILNSLPEQWHVRMQGLFNPLEDISFAARMFNWSYHWELFLDSPLFGLGPAKGLVSYNVDNEWLLLLVRHGVMAPLLVFFMGLSLFLKSYKIMRFSMDNEMIAINSALVSNLMVIPLIMITSGLYYVQQLMAVIMLLLGVAHQNTLLISSTDSLRNRSMASNQ